MEINDGGITWAAINNWTGHSSYNISGVATVHADKHALRVSNWYNSYLKETTAASIKLQMAEQRGPTSQMG